MIVGPSGAGENPSSMLVGGSKVMLHPGTVRSARVAQEAGGQISDASTYTPATNLTLGGSFGTADPPAVPPRGPEPLSMAALACYPNACPCLLACYPNLCRWPLVC